MGGNLCFRHDCLNGLFYTFLDVRCGWRFVPREDLIVLKNDTGYLLEVTQGSETCFACLSVFVPPTSIPITHGARFVVIAGWTYTGPADLEVANGDI